MQRGGVEPKKRFRGERRNSELRMENVKMRERKGTARENHRKLKRDVPMWKEKANQR